jgi:metal-sulfur cluster biosynthetic enzyme
MTPTTSSCPNRFLMEAAFDRLLVYVEVLGIFNISVNLKKGDQV